MDDIQSKAVWYFNIRAREIRCGDIHYIKLLSKSSFFKRYDFFKQLFGHSVKHITNWKCFWKVFQILRWWLKSNVVPRHACETQAIKIHQRYFISIQFTSIHKKSIYNQSSHGKQKFHCTKWIIEHTFQRSKTW